MKHRLFAILLLGSFLAGITHFMIPHHHCGAKDHYASCLTHATHEGHENCSHDTDDCKVILSDADHHHCMPEHIHESIIESRSNSSIKLIQAEQDCLFGDIASALQCDLLADINLCCDEDESLRILCGFRSILDSRGPPNV